MCPAETRDRESFIIDRGEEVYYTALSVRARGWLSLSAWSVVMACAIRIGAGE